MLSADKKTAPLSLDRFDHANAALWLREAEDFSCALFDAVRVLSADGSGVTREAFGHVESAALEEIEKAGRALGLSARRDAAGNLWLDWLGRDPDQPAIVLGSHADSVPEGGNFDGLAGIVAGLAALLLLSRRGVSLARTVSVLALRGEENSFYGKPYLGSRAILGLLEPADLQLVRRDGTKTLEEAMRGCGLTPEALATGQPLLDLSRLRCFIELHIEQGPMLDMEAETRTGIVTGIRGLYSHKAIRCERADRNREPDAVPRAVTELLVRMEAHWQAALECGADLVETTGVIGLADEALGDAACAEADCLRPVEAMTFAFDIRSLDAAECLGFHALLEQEAAAVAEKRGVRFLFDSMLDSHPAKMDAGLREILHRAAKAANVPVRDIASGAGHDSAYFANAGIPTAMIFVANQLGSHNPHEAMRMADFMAGVKLLATALPMLDSLSMSSR